jgi:putative hydrolase of the HAD superfamily
MAYQLVLFDIGGVVVEVASDRLVHQVAQLVGRPFDETLQAIYDTELLLPFELGRLHASAYYQGLVDRLGVSWTYEQFVHMWNSIFTEDPGVTQLMRRLRPRHRLTALTNTNALHLAHLRASLPSMSLLHDWVASCEVGLRKPDPAIYRLALERAGVEPQQAIYIDDRPELVEAGQRAGLSAIRFEHSRQLEQALRALGLVF